MEILLKLSMHFEAEQAKKMPNFFLLLLQTTTNQHAVFDVCTIINVI